MKSGRLRKPPVPDLTTAAEAVHSRGLADPI
jgi:hypothetical protein